MDLSIYLRYYSAASIYFSFRWGPFVHSLEIVQWDSTRRDHPGNLGGVSGSGPVTNIVFSLLKAISHAYDHSKVTSLARKLHKGWAMALKSLMNLL